MKKLKLLFFIVIGVTLYGTSSFWMPARIAGVYHGEDYMTVSNIHYNSTVVLVDNPPFTKKGMRELWARINRVVLDGHNAMQGKYDKVVFLKNNLARPYNASELNYWQGDNQFCLKGILNKKCISKDDVFFIVTSGKTTINSEKIESYKGDEYYIGFISR